MKVREFQFQVADLDVDRGTVERVMGYEEWHSPDPFPAMIDEVLNEAPGLCDIRGGYLIRESIEIERENRLLHIDGASFDIKNIIAAQLRKAEGAALFVCTAGEKIGKYAAQLMKSGDLLKGYIVDVVGSEMVESAMDAIQNKLAAELEANGLYITDRYSPGYCGWNVSEQHKLFSFFPDNFCGVTLTPTALMQPIKSVSGVIGIGHQVKRRGYVCHLCQMTDCIYRNKRHVKKADRC
jgi:hypothetical protein